VTPQQLAEWSNHLIGSAMAVYAGALVAHAGEIAFSRIRAGDADEARELVTVGAVSATEDGVPLVAASSHRPAERESKADAWGRSGVALTVLGFALHLGGVVLRGVSAERVPWGNMYEFSITSALAVAGVYLLLLRRHAVRYLGDRDRARGAGDAGPGPGEALHRVGGARAGAGLVLAGHPRVAAIISSGLFTVGAVLTVLYLVRARAEKRERLGGWTGRLPSSTRLDALAYRLNAFAFPLWTFTVVAGAIWAENAWGRSWNWDPKEVWAFITWVVYAGYLHARATAGWRRSSAAWIGLAGYSTFLFNYLIVNIFFPGLHSYAGV
jgi:ABC-type transport system involved in cytochrome c biogenesis permease subunit